MQQLVFDKLEGSVTTMTAINRYAGERVHLRGANITGSPAISEPEIDPTVIIGNYDDNKRDRSNRHDVVCNYYRQ